MPHLRRHRTGLGLRPGREAVAAQLRDLRRLRSDMDRRMSGPQTAGGVPCSATTDPVRGDADTPPDTTRESALVWLDTDPAAGLRATAALIRETAECAMAACPLPWRDAGEQHASFGHRVVDRNQREISGAAPVVLDQVASWSPAPALAIARWLESAAVEIGPITFGPGVVHDVHAAPHALAVARAWLTGEVQP